MDIRFIDYAVKGDKAVITAHTGETRKEFTQEQIVGQIVVDVAKIPDVFKTAGGEEKSLKAYGISSLLQDRSSQAKGQSEKFEYMQAEAERLMSEGALWAVTRESAPKAPKAPKVDALLAQALAELKGCTVTVAAAYVGKLDKDSLAELAGKEVVKAKIAELKAAAAEAEELDLSDLL